MLHYVLHVFYFMLLKNIVSLYDNFMIIYNILWPFHNFVCCNDNFVQKSEYGKLFIGIAKRILRSAVFT